MFSGCESCGEVYNCVWEESLGLSYSVLHCRESCGHVIGVLVHSIALPAYRELQGKVSPSIIIMIIVEWIVFVYDSLQAIISVLDS